MEDGLGIEGSFHTIMKIAKDLDEVKTSPTGAISSDPVKLVGVHYVELPVFLGFGRNDFSTTTVHKDCYDLF